MKRLIPFFCALFLLISSMMPLSAQAQEGNSSLTDSQAQAAALLANLTPEERVAQLFLVTFKGIDVSQTSQIYDLIYKHHIGGVVLLSKNDNFVSSGITVSDAFRLVSSLQNTEWAASQQYAADPITGNSFKPNYIPLFIATSQPGDSYPDDQIINGLTTLPNEMAIGATWKPDLATQVGKVLGNELQAIGFNLLMGPSLDVLQLNQNPGTQDLGTNIFGGDPYWVGQMSQAYISGIHQGSSNRIAVIADHFPGSGAADRSPENEVATVLKSLDELNNFDLAPFYAVTGNASTPDSATDGLLVSHIRYQGFQGNIRSTTRPISSDQAALTQLLALPAISAWRDKGGLMVSDDLGSRAIRRFYDPSEKTFDARQVARTAFLAGNDLLFVDNFTANGDPDSYTTILNTLEYFAQKYREDTSFMQRVDASVLRILALKFHLYGSFTLDSVIPPETDQLSLGNSQQVVNDVASQAVTLISPTKSELNSVLPKGPDLKERIIFFTDVMTGRQCSQCGDQTLFSVDGLQRAVLRLYGPQVGNLVTAENLSSYSLTDLQNYLNKSKAPANLESDMNFANWVVFAFLNPTTDRPGPDILRQLLSDRPDLLTNKHVIAFAFNAPYYLDATDISKLTAYYALYSKAPSFIDAASRVLFQEMPIKGASPVTVPGIGYDIISVTSPDPNQIIPLVLDIPEQITPTVTITPAPTQIPRFKVGDSIPIRTGVIYDQNHNPVPDNTPVRFYFTIGGDTANAQTLDVVTVQGVAHITYHIDKAGLIEIHATSDPAKRSDQIYLDTTSKEGGPLVVSSPTPYPSVTFTSTATGTDTPTPTITVTPTPTPTPLPPRQDFPNLIEWLLTLIVIATGAVLSFFVAYLWQRSVLWSLRWGLCVVLGGLLSYLYLALGFPGGSSWIRGNSTGGIIGVASMGILIGWSVGLVWWFFQGNRNFTQINR